MSLTKTTRDKILRWHRQGISVDETARILHLPERLIVDIIRQPPAETKPEFTPPPTLNL